MSQMICLIQIFALLLNGCTSIGKSIIDGPISNTIEYKYGDKVFKENIHNTIHTSSSLIHWLTMAGLFTVNPIIGGSYVTGSIVYTKVLYSLDNRKKE